MKEKHNMPPIADEKEGEGSNQEVTVVPVQAETACALDLPFADQGIRAGFPSPAQDYLTETIDLNRELVRHPATTFYARACGESMRGRGIDDGDLLVIDKSLEPREGDSVVAYVDGEFTLKQLHHDRANQCVWLMPANEEFSPIKLTEENHCMLWGIVTYNIKSQRH